MDAKTKKKITDSELECRLVIEFHKEGIKIDCKNISSNRIVMAAVALLNQGLDQEGMQKFMNLMAISNKILEKKDEK